MKNIWIEECAVCIFSSSLNEKYIGIFSNLAKFLALFFYQNIHKEQFHSDISNSSSNSNSNII